MVSMVWNRPYVWNSWCGSHDVGSLVWATHELCRQWCGTLGVDPPTFALLPSRRGQIPPQSPCGFTAIRWPQEGMTAMPPLRDLALSPPLGSHLCSETVLIHLSRYGDLWHHGVMQR